MTQQEPLQVHIVRLRGVLRICNFTLLAAEIHDETGWMLVDLGSQIWDKPTPAVFRVLVV